MRPQQITNKELNNIIYISLIFTLRIFNSSIILPTISTYGMTLKEANECLIGLSIGIYGITQAIFQIPCGIISDKIERKTIIIGILIIFIIGSSIAATTNDIWSFIISRAIQGIGAVNSPILALLFELTQKNNRTKAMAFLGIGVGSGFALSLVIGSFYIYKIGLHGLFWIMNITTIISIIIIFFIPNQNNQHNNKNKIQKYRKIIKIKKNNIIKKLITKQHFLLININIFFLHSILILNFMGLPIKMNIIGVLNTNQWKIYLITIITTLIMSTPFIIYAEKKIYIKNILILFIVMILSAEIILLNTKLQIFTLLLGMQLFFISFNVIEAILPSTLSKLSSKKNYGMNMGMFSTSQFMGIFFGGVLGGWLLKMQANSQLIFLTGIFLSLLLLIINIIKHKTFKNI